MNAKSKVQRGDKFAVYAVKITFNGQYIGTNSRCHSDGLRDSIPIAPSDFITIQIGDVGVLGVDLQKATQLFAQARNRNII